MLSNTLHKSSRELFQNYIASQGFIYGLVIVLENILKFSFHELNSHLQGKTFSSKQKKI